MSSETFSPETGRVSFEELGEAIVFYEKADLEYFQARHINRVHDEPGFTTISGQELEDWKQKFPKVNDLELALRKEKLEVATVTFVNKLGLEDADIISPLARCYHNEVVRRSLEESCGSNENDPWRAGITIQEDRLEPRQMIAGAITMAQLTGETYKVHYGPVVGMTYYYAYANVEPTLAVEDVVAQFSEQGVEIPPATS